VSPPKGPERARPEGSRILGRHRALLEDPLVQSWWEERSLRSRLSADTYLRHIGLFVERLELPPPALLELARKRPEKLRDRLVQYAAEQKRAGRLESYISKSFEGLSSFFKHHRVRFDEFPKLSPIRGASLSKERVPTQQELGQVLERLSQRGRVTALFLAHTGVRPGVLGSYGGEAGLTLEDLPDLELGPPDRMRETPFLIRVRADLSKTRRQYNTFGTEQLATALLAYLQARRASGEKLEGSSPVLVPGWLRGAAVGSRRWAKFGRGFIATKNVVLEIRDALHASLPEGVTWRPYVLRSYCSTRLLLAEGQGRISRDLREALLGHDGGIASRYNVGKRWGEELLTEARREYGRASEFLETTAQSRTNVADEFRRTVLEVSGLAGDELAQHMRDSNDEILAILRTKLLGLDSGVPPVPGARGPQKAVPLAEAERLLGEGWVFVANFGPDRVLLQPPAKLSALRLESLERDQAKPDRELR
jgi:hypothetical protein